MSKEEISKLKINVFNQCDDETIRLVAEMLKENDKLESDKQKLIEKLEEDIKDLINQTKENDLREKANYTLLYLSKYRKILKGKNHE